MSWFKKRSYEGRHVFITGGSQGIGLALAEEFLLLGASVSMVARTKSTLEAATAKLQKVIKEKDLKGRAVHVSADVQKYEGVQSAVKQAEERLGPINVAVCCAGFSLPGRFLEQDVKLFEDSMQLLYFGSLYTAKAVLPSMVKQSDGQFLFVASPLACAGISGYSTYAPAKYALHGLADVLRNELAGSGVKISIGYPLDTDTPGYANENKTKPPETEEISRFAGGSVYSAEKIAKGLIAGLRREHYHIRTPDFLLNLLISSTSNIGPKCYLLVFEILMAPFLVIILTVYGKLLDRIVVKHRKDTS